ncbi:hypothetical protein KDH83_24740 [Achromobacter sp. Marseille-Q0513]|uniref:hypothetical protein n=1 Tax=Achromobacter sp. Marseille-Q0513 TaxID=2829161 RepID=UPI001B94B237|nr:hypothetical protein [Achromobacter sp. Marseille-Q0513]MBR8656525.1 hypothetical protein [Achromobacter sp. Marseille-Q0513]
MSAADIELWFYARPNRGFSIEQRHARVMDGMSRFGAPLGFKGLNLPIAPDCGGELAAVYGIKLPVRGLKFIGDYTYRGEKYVYHDRAYMDEHIRYGFKISNKKIDYSDVVKNQIPKVVEAFEPYRVRVDYDMYAFNYQGRSPEDNPIYFKLREDESINIDGRNNIYTLYPAQFWDAELCERALGYGPDEVVARLQGKVQDVRRLTNGVYLVLNDDPELTYEDFVEMNQRIKPMLGVV